jgi:3D (Asp-Asp-Asp) domain-containing protein
VVTAGTVIDVKRVAVQLVTESYKIPAPVQRMDDPQMERGESRLVRAGTPGEGQRLVKVTYVNGKAVKSLLVKDTVLRPPQSRLIAYGTVTSISRGGRTIRFRDSMEAVATAYSYRNGSYTCTGQRARFGVVAVDPSVIPLGTRLYIDGYGYATAGDIGSAIKGNRVDVFFESEGDADNWGRRYTKVYILDE